MLENCGRVWIDERRRGESGSGGGIGSIDLSLLLEIELSRPAWISKGSGVNIHLGEKKGIFIGGILLL